MPLSPGPIIAEWAAQVVVIILLLTQIRHGVAIPACESRIGAAYYFHRRPGEQDCRMSGVEQRSNSLL
jgi:hypothetical protein